MAMYSSIPRSSLWNYAESYKTRLRLGIRKSLDISGSFWVINFKKEKRRICAGEISNKRDTASNQPEKAIAPLATCLFSQSEQANQLSKL